MNAKSAKLFLGSLLTALGVGGGYMAYEATTTYSTLGDALWARGCRQALWIPTTDVNARRTSLFSPGDPFDGFTPSQFAARYGVTLVSIKGNTVGERYSRDGLAEWIATGAAGVAQPYTITAQDDNDAKFVTCNSYQAAWDSLISPYVPPTPTPPPTATPPPPTPTPWPTPTPTPTPPPAPSGGLQHREIPCPSVRSTAQSCYEVWL